MSTLMETTLTTPLGKLDEAGRLLNAVFRAPPQGRPRRLPRELALQFATNLAVEARPPELSCDSHGRGEAGSKTLPFFAGYLLSSSNLKAVAVVMATCSPRRQVLPFCN